MPARSDSASTSRRSRSLSMLSMRLTHLAPTRARTLLVCRCPIKCQRMSAGRRFALSRSSCTRLRRKLVGLRSMPRPQPRRGEILKPPQDRHLQGVSTVWRQVIVISLSSDGDFHLVNVHVGGLGHLHDFEIGQGVFHAFHESVVCVFEIGSLNEDK